MDTYDAASSLARPQTPPSLTLSSFLPSSTLSAVSCSKTTRAPSLHPLSPIFHCSLSPSSHPSVRSPVPALSHGPPAIRSLAVLRSPPPSLSVPLISLPQALPLLALLALSTFLLLLFPLSILAVC